jgi:paraquat-inducible protein B
MSLKAHKPRIYLFAIGALLFGAVMFFSFGGKQLLAQHESFVLYFDESVNGVGTRSTVKFKGVPIGYVTEVRLNYHQAPGDHRVPVLININVGQIRAMGALGDLADPQMLQIQIRRGLRAQLRVVSHVTGVMYVDLNYYPDAPPAPVEEPGLLVIPTMLSDQGKVLQKTEKFLAWLPTFDFVTHVEGIDDHLDSLSDRVGRVPFSEANPRVAKMLAPAAKLDAAHWDQQFDNAETKLDQFQATLDHANAQVTAQSQKLLDGGPSLGQSLDRINAALASVRDDLQPAAKLPAELDHALKPAADLAQSLDLKVNALEKQPSLLTPHPPPAADAPAGTPPTR